MATASAKVNRQTGMLKTIGRCSVNFMVHRPRLKIGTKVSKSELKLHLWGFLCRLVSAESRSYLKAEEILRGKTFRERTHRGVVDRDFLDIALTCHSNPVFGSFELRL